MKYSIHLEILVGCTAQVFFFNLTQASVIWEEGSLNWENASQDSHVDKYVVQFLDW